MLDNTWANSDTARLADIRGPWHDEDRVRLTLLGATEAWPFDPDAFGTGLALAAAHAFAWELVLNLAYPSSAPRDVADAARDALDQFWLMRDTLEGEASDPLFSPMLSANDAPELRPDSPCADCHHPYALHGHFGECAAKDSTDWGTEGGTCACPGWVAEGDAV